MKNLPSVSVVIPTRNEERNLGRLLPQLLALVPAPQIIVSDGGSSDATLIIAREFGVEVLSEAEGRGPQLNAGALRSTGDVILFLHADSSLPSGSYRALLKTLHDEPGLDGGAFRFSLLNTPGMWARIYECNVWLRNRLLHLPYGDQGFFLRQIQWNKDNNFAQWPLMEDVEWWERVSRKLCVRILPWPLITSARRFQQRGFFLSSLCNLWTLTRYKLGVSPVKLAKEYHQ